MREQYKVEDSAFLLFGGCFASCSALWDVSWALWMHTLHVKLSRYGLRRRYKKKKLTKDREMRTQSVENTRELRLMCVLSVTFKRSRLLRCLSDDPVAPLGCPATRVA